MRAVLVDIRTIKRERTRQMIYDDECPMCGTSNMPVRKIGDRLHYRCQDCGAMYYETLEDILSEGEADE